MQECMKRREEERGEWGGCARKGAKGKGKEAEAGAVLDSGRSIV